MTGARIGDYSIERKLGSGGMGSVYLGRSRSGRAVAIKVIRPEYAADPRFRDRFRKEVEAARRVGGFHTAAVVDADPDAAQPWMASAYVKGPTLAEAVARRGPLDETGLRSLAAALAEALEAIHGCGLVHRDLKPGNIILAEDGPRVLDFGIAQALEGTRLTVDGAAVGTPGFIAPEQVLGHAITGACDVFALGAVLVAAAGGSAFGEGSPYGLMYRAVHDTPDVTALPAALRPLVEACLHKEPEQRPSPRRLLDLCAVGTDHPATVVDAPDAPLDAVPTVRAVRPRSESMPTRRAANTRASAAPRQPARTAPPLALYRRNRLSWAIRLTRNLLIMAGFIMATVLGSMYDLPDAVPGTGFLGAFFMAIRLVFLYGSTNDGIVIDELGIVMGSPNNPALLQWTHMKSMELDDGAREMWLTVRCGERQYFPLSLHRPLWVRNKRNGTIHIRTRWLRPIGDTPPLPDALRAFAAHRHVPLTETRAG
ncbi:MULTISPECIES: serine/threonine-protein kinase [Streptomyces]|uniref:Serine/threonine-protein kinase n=1 Tax=Streptomyces edwardsiae TaxID=3075527 RepID=A0ABU2QMY0_9ACTN|nr:MULTISPECIES: serine/threonine-protein kinase [unclassified Streptomyces]MDT0405214.1 serine/threonine-protein kinase [Streptomyces sp. DSM 41635]